MLNAACHCLKLKGDLTHLLVLIILLSDIKSYLSAGIRQTVASHPKFAFTPTFIFLAQYVLIIVVWLFCCSVKSFTGGTCGFSY